MKISVASDLHLEFCYNKNIMPKLDNVDNAEVLVLAGDIVTAGAIEDKDMRLGMYWSFIYDCAQKWQHIIVIAGNHEFYHGDWYRSLETLKSFYAQWPNVYFLEDSAKDINGTRFIGCTLWTDMRHSDGTVMHACRDMMNDFRLVTNSGKGFTPLTPYDTVLRHVYSLSYIRAALQDNCVVVSHHLPSYASIAPKYRNSDLVNHAFYSELSDMMLDSKIKLWVHGHTHDACDYMLGDTRVVCNPLWYPGENGRVYGPVTVEI